MDANDKANLYDVVAVALDKSAEGFYKSGQIAKFLESLTEHGFMITKKENRSTHHPMTPAKQVLQVEVFRWPTRRFGISQDRTGAWAVNAGRTSLWITTKGN